MKKVEAIIRKSKLEEVIKELNRHQFFGLTVTPVMGCGRQEGRTQLYRGTEYNVNLHSKVKIETVVKDSWVEEVIETIKKSAYTGEIGDGKIFVLNVENAYRISTGEKGEDAIL